MRDVCQSLDGNQLSISDAGKAGSRAIRDSPTDSYGFSAVLHGVHELASRSNRPGWANDGQLIRSIRSQVIY